MPTHNSGLRFGRSAIFLDAQRFVAAGVLTLALAGCTVGPKYNKPTAPVPATYKESPANFPSEQVWKVADPQEAMLRGKWWEIFNDPELNALQEQLEQGNQTVAQAYHNFMAAREIIHQARSQYFPLITSSPSITRSASSG